ncbi:MAG: efflux RND transporter permease subunit [Gammaproteobacteria bacterium]|nr:efflux RND transporter permease subunit [Gammaproteobacteria bacterium]
MRPIIEFVVTNRLFTILFAFVVLLAALTNLPNLRISQLPTIEMPVLMIDVSLPGASSREIEQRVINTIESASKQRETSIASIPPSPTATPLSSWSTNTAWTLMKSTSISIPRSTI